MLVEIKKLDHQGRGVAYLDKPVFVDNALPGEVVDIKITVERSKYMLAEVLKYIKTSDIRVNPLCPYYSKCGGCQIMHLPYDEQLKYKENKIKEIVSKYLKENIKIENIIPSNQFKYRNKITLKYDGKLGLYKKRSNNIIEIDSCLLVKDDINEKIKSLENVNTDEVVIRSGENITSSLNEEDTIIKLKDYKFIVKKDSFFQVNNDTTIKLYDKVIEYLDLSKDDNILDLYCGVGSIGIYLSSYVKSVYGVEINASAIESAKENKKINNVNNIDFKCLDAADISALKVKANKVVVDPPRSGLNKKTISFLNNNNFDNIIYVSCDPMTLMRDLKLLGDKYSIISLTPVDMFPNTYHVESVVKLKKKI